MKNIFLALTLFLAFTGFSKRANAGIIATVQGTAYSVVQGLEDPLYFPVGLGITAVVGGGLIWSSTALIDNNAAGSFGKVAGIVLLVLSNESLSEFENLVEIRYPFIENVDAKRVLAEALKASYDLTEKSDFMEVSLNKEEIGLLSVVMGLTQSQESILLSDLLPSK